MSTQQIDNLIYNQAVKMGVPPTVARLIVAQAQYETFFNGKPYNSPVFKANNNAFGYKFVGQKKWPIGAGTSAASQDAQGNPDGGIYARYANVENSTGEIVDWLYRRQRDKVFTVANLTTPQLYASALKKAGYYGQLASQYASGLSNRLKNVFIVASGTATLLLLVAGFFF